MAQRSNLLGTFAKSLILTMTTRALRNATDGDRADPNIATRVMRRVAQALEEQSPTLDSEYQHQREQVAAEGLSGKLRSAVMDAFLDGARDQQTQAPAEPSPNGDMSRPAALEIFDLQENATHEQIEEAYSRLIKRNHPDLGGSNFFAKKINEARQTLLGKRRA